MFPREALLASTQGDLIQNQDIQEQAAQGDRMDTLLSGRDLAPIARLDEASTGEARRDDRHPQDVVRYQRELIWLNTEVMSTQTPRV